MCTGSKSSFLYQPFMVTGQTAAALAFALVLGGLAFVYYKKVAKA